MSTDNAYSLQDLADLADVSPRTIRYYVAQGLLPSPGEVGRGARYSDGHLARLRLIRRLQREHLPLAEIRTRLAFLDDDTIADLVETDAPAPPEGSALDYVRAILAGAPSDPAPTVQASYIAPASKAIFPLAIPGLRRPQGKGLAPSGPARLAEAQPERLAESRPQPTAPSQPSSTEPIADRSQWDRVTFTPDIELHIRRPLSRQQNKRVDRLIAIARELLEEEPS